MATKPRTSHSEKPRVRAKSKAQQALEFARCKAKECESWIEFGNAMFGIGGKFGELFSTESERAQFLRTEEYAEIAKLMDEFDGPTFADYSGHFMVRGPRSLHAALVKEAEAEGVSLNQLCISKLALQLRAIVN
jgi:predicted HicB family RNase H-like nuclease